LEHIKVTEVGQLMQNCVLLAVLLVEHCETFFEVITAADEHPDNVVVVGQEPEVGDKQQQISVDLLILIGLVVVGDKPVLKFFVHKQLLGFIFVVLHLLVFELFSDDIQKVHVTFYQGV